jgi:aspartyl-tRNA(Asn)/glutamyl-tRNA(Gln) amidotransferase subunit B
VRRARLAEAWAIGEFEMATLVNAGILDIVEETVAAGVAPDAARKWWSGEFTRAASERGVEPADLPVTSADIARVEELIASGALNDKLARQVFEAVLAGEGSPDEVVAARGLAVVSDDGPLLEAIDAALAEQPDVAEKIRSGKLQAAGAIVGAVMKTTRGQADAGRVRELLLERLGVEG